MSFAQQVAAAGAHGEWSPLLWAGYKGWSRQLALDPHCPRTVVLAVWDDGHEHWEWEIFDGAEDRHLAGGKAETARDALAVVIKLVENGAIPRWLSKAPSHEAQEERDAIG